MEDHLIIESLEQDDDFSHPGTLHILQQYDAFSFIQKQCSGSRPEILIMVQFFLGFSFLHCLTVLRV